MTITALPSKGSTEWSDWARDIDRTARGGEVIDLVLHGITPGAGDQSAKINALIAANPAHSTFVLPEGDYSIDSSILVNKPLTLRGRGRLKSTMSSTACIEVSASDVNIYGVRAEGPQRAVWTNGGRGISIVGALGAELKRIHVAGVALSNYGGSAIVASFAQQINFDGVTINGCTYYGIALLSCSKVLIDRAVISDINKGGLPNSYGVTASRLNGTLEVNPRSADVTMQNSTVSDVPDWVGFDTHGGLRIRSINNNFFRCKRAIDFVGSVGPTPEGGTATVDFAPLEFAIIGGVCDGTGIATSHGVGASGATGTPGAPRELATGIIQGVTIIRSGDPTNNALGGVWLRGTLGVKISNMVLVECGSHGICLSNDNYGFGISNITSIDAWSDTHTIPSVVATRSTYNTGSINGIYGRRGSKVAANVQKYGIYNSDATENTTISVGSDCFIEGAGSILVAESAAGQRTFMRMTATRNIIGRGNSTLAFFEGPGSTKITGTPPVATDLASAIALVNFFRGALKDGYTIVG